nr:uncharacterized protein LOC109191529 [Ipomoea batatas]
MTKTKDSKRKATEEGETSIAKEPRTNSAPEQAEEQAQQLTQEHADQRQVEPIQSPEQNDNTKQESEDESEEDGSGQSNDGELHIKVPTNKNNQKLENFDPRSCTLQLQNGQSIHITATDVAATLGLPMGQIEITRRTARAVPEILNEMEGNF